jgi:glycosyltransferase involved in cell wall biosynthesis
MPVGVDLNTFKIDQHAIRGKNSVCMIGRVSPIKGVDLAINAIGNLIQMGVEISLTIIGPVAEKDSDYFGLLKQYIIDHNLASFIKFKGPVSPNALKEIYNQFEICLNLTESGSFDKTIVEAAACGCIPLVSNASLATMLPAECITKRSLEDVVQNIQKLLHTTDKTFLYERLEKFAEDNSLVSLMNKLAAEI